jgi:glyoxylase-like metal-dependent hydrolase (beta-lactamase superfamily II)
MLKLGHRIEELKLIVNTHSHPDHIGGDAEIQKRSHAEIAIHPLEAVALRDPSKFWTEETAKAKELITMSGVPKLMERLMTSGLLTRGRLGTGVPERTEVSLLLTDSSTIDLGPFSLQVVHTPGHTPGHIALHNPNTGILFSGDHILQETTPNVQNLTSFIESLNRVLQLDPRTALPGHEGLIHEPRRRILELLEHHRARERAFLGLVRGSRGKTLYQLASEYWGLLSPRHLTLALREARAHLAKLAKEGLVTEEWEGNTLLYLPSEGQERL